MQEPLPCAYIRNTEISPCSYYSGLPILVAVITIQTACVLVHQRGLERDRVPEDTGRLPSPNPPLPANICKSNAPEKDSPFLLSCILAPDSTWNSPIVTPPCTDEAGEFEKAQVSYLFFCSLNCKRRFTATTLRNKDRQRTQQPPCSADTSFET